MGKSLKVPKWLERRLDKGLLGPDCEAPGMPGQQISALCGPTRKVLKPGSTLFKPVFRKITLAVM